MIKFEIGYFRKFRTSVTLTMTLDRVVGLSHIRKYQISFKSENLLVDVRKDVH